jgi:hypothetical protein
MMGMVDSTKLFGMVALAVLATGCSSIRMVETESTKVVPAGKVLVTFVRQSVWMGDGIPVDLWDGERYIGVLGPGTIVQYVTTPGEHLFLGNAENWTYASGSLVADRRYYVKANVFMGFATARVAFGVADNSDDRVEKWHVEYTAKAAHEKDRVAFEEEALGDVQEAIQRFKSGGVASFATITDTHAH